MSGVLAPQWLIQALTDAGAVASGARLFSFVAGGGNVPSPLYADKALTTPLANPYQFNSAGRGEFWLDPAITYRLRLETATGALLAERDGVEGTATAKEWVRKDDLANASDPAKGAGLIGWLSQTVGYWINLFRTFITDLAEPSGAGLIGHGGSTVGATLDAIQEGMDSGTIGYATKADMDADLAHDAGTVAYVMNDATDANNTTYRKTGASGAGSWIATNALPTLIDTNRIADGAVKYAKTDFVQLGKNLFDKAIAEIGVYVSNTTGFEIANALYDASVFIPVVPGVTYSGKGPTQGMRMTCYFDASQAFVSGGAPAGSTTTFTVPAGVAFVRISIYHVDLDSFQFEEAAAPTEFQQYGYEIPQLLVYNLEEKNIADGAVAPAKTNFLRVGKNLFNKANAAIGYYVSNTGFVIANASYDASDYIAVIPGETYSGRGAANGMRFTCYFNASKGYVAGGAPAGNTVSFTVPAGVYFVRVTSYHVDLDTFQFEHAPTPTAFQAYGYEFYGPGGEPLIVEASEGSGPWANKKWGQLGDSITFQNQWQPSVSIALGLLGVNYGISGTRISGPGGDASAMCQDTRINAVASDCDLVTVLGGTNDFLQNIAMGVVTSTTATEFYGALNTMASKLMARFPAKRVAWITTPYGERGADFATYGWSNAYTNTQGLTARDYAEAVREVARRWGIPCIEVFANAGWNASNKATYLNADVGPALYVHPNAAGGKRVAEVVVGALSALEPIA